MRWFQSSQGNNMAITKNGYQVVKELDNKRIKVSELQGFGLSLYKVQWFEYVSNLGSLFNISFVCIYGVVLYLSGLYLVNQQSMVQKE